MHCYYCGHNKLKSLHKSHRQQTSRWRYYYICKSCNKLFNYRYIINHNKSYKNVLFDILSYSITLNTITPEYNQHLVNIRPICIVDDEGNHSAPVFIGRKASSRTAPYISLFKSLDILSPSFNK